MQPSVPSTVIHRSTVLNIESPENPPPVHNTGVALPGTSSLPPAELYQHAGMMPMNLNGVVAIGGVAPAADDAGAILPPNLNYYQIESILAMAGVPPSIQQLIDEQQQGVVGIVGGPISEASRKEAAAAARALRAAKRKEEKQRKQRKTSKGATAELQAAATATGIAALTPAAAVGAAAGAQPTSSGRGGRGTKNASNDKTEQRAIKNRESAARSRAKRVEQVCALETQVEQLKSQNRNLRTEVIKKAAAPPDPYTGKGIDGQPLRRTRTMPL